MADLLDIFAWIMAVVGVVIVLGVGTQLARRGGHYDDPADPAQARRLAVLAGLFVIAATVSLMAGIT